MSTALVSAFYDVGDIIYQNRKNSLSKGMDRKAVGTPIPRRHSSTSTSGITPGSPPNSPTSSMISFQNESSLFGRELTKKSLDRSVSEPGDRSNNNQNNQRNGNHQQQNINSSRYKTELCRPYEESGHCKYGDKCQFAHGAHELRTLNRHPKYKTELCRTFHTIGFCPYGPRCHFIHNDDERKMNQINNGKQQHMQHQQLQNLQNQLQQQQQQAAFQPMRPRALSFNVTMSLGSTADSPPSSVSDSPSLSPIFFGDDISSLPETPFCNNITASKFNFNFGSQELPPSPANPASYTFNPHALAAALSNQHNNNDSVFVEEVFGAPPPSPPDSLVGEEQTCGSPLDVSRGLRLPIFSRLSLSDDPEL
ncbi:mRNA decay activator protein ZFP36L1 [Lingula anatina]|uniref:mRNA decay activator protein ZFP36L1 n=1 Tax=Lingula anatina TaxID=7574 RepID=A0A1S3HJJ7_LINAN|nr:mRNA decay activator protein ZFP36L1 [Lingula anatina]|eukprot:XP_013386293.1 mRNA decay activator protein ZFP36L1 [Lingula anatina]